MKNIKNNLIEFLKWINEKLIIHWIIFLIVFSAIFLSSAKTILFFNESPFDGVFQTLFSLRKMDQGELPGRDFFYFHGNGIPYIIYPAYKIFTIILGGELYSSLWATFIVNGIFLLVPIAIIFYKLYGIKYSIVAVTVFTLITEQIFFLGFYNSILFLGAPMGIRLFPHCLLMLIACFIYTKDINYKKVFYISAISAITPLLGAEQGIFFIFGSSLAFFLCMRGLSRITFSLFYLIASIGLFLIYNFLFFGSFETISAMKVISDNQMWIYGVYPNTFFFNITDAFKIIKSNTIPSQLTCLISIILSIIFYCKVKNPMLRVGSFSFLFGALFSWASNVGYVGQHQSGILFKYIFIISTILMVNKILNNNQR